MRYFWDGNARLVLSQFWGCLILLCGLEVSLASASEITKFEYNLWEALFQEMHPEQEPPWTSREQFDDWLQDNKESVELIVVRWIAQDRGTASWKRGIYVAKRVQTARICDAVYTSMRQTATELEARGKSLRDADPGDVVGFISILAAARDSRATQFANELLRSSTPSYRWTKRCLEALRDVGDGDSVAAIEELIQRGVDEHTERNARLAIKVIRARLAGEPVSPNAQQELRDLFQRFLRAAKEGDYGAYVACLPFAMKNVVDQGDMAEFLSHADTVPALDALRRSLESGNMFEVDLDNLRAELTGGNRYQLDCILEVDGWKVLNVRPLRPETLKRE